jgi:hypothetical protein
MAKPKREANRTAGRVSRRKASGSKTIERSAGSGRGTAEKGRPVGDPKRDGGVSTNGALPR